VLATGLSERVCLVTGAAKGIGRACAELLAGEDARLALCDIDGSGLEDTGLDAWHAVCDVSRRSEVERLLQGVIERYGRLDVLIHCAGVYTMAPLPEVSDDEWDRVLDVNLRSSYLLCQAAVERMREHADGRIVLFGSFAARTGGLRASIPYAASKAGVEGITRHVAAYAGPLGIRVNCVHPGLTHTPMTSALTDEARSEAYARTPLGRGCEPSEPAAMAVVLASDLASFVHGVTLDVNGGMYMA
jgi:NAD(P)-dependent dehydrogenase (short-subunit alcohol dehydrogenase family)